MNNSPALMIVPLLFILSACAAEQPTIGLPTEVPDRSSRIAENAQKIGPAADQYPPILHSGEWEAPVPLPGPINTAGGEDSPFITPDGRNFFFFFTPDISIPAEKQLTDGVTGIYQSRWVEGSWTDPTRLLLSDGLALDGCPMVVGSQIWFCTAREGLTGLHWFKANYAFGTWGEWEMSDFDPDYLVGEIHITADGQELYFHSDRPGTLGENDIWLSQINDGIWGEPINLAAVNSSADDSRPFISSDGQQLWFTRTYLGSPAVFLSNRVDGGWSEPILIVSQFAGEPTLDQDGNLYFVHHFLRDGVLVEADIYLAKKK